LLQDTENLLQYACVGIVDNEQASVPRQTLKSGKPIKSIRERLVGKGGRVRGNLMGKRVDFSARSVITPDPNLMLDQLGVPRSVAMNLTVPEIVNRHNIQRLRQLCDTGATSWPGAKMIFPPIGNPIDLRYAKQSEKHLEYGYKVERHLSDGDVVIFNRQPSLHKMSMMGHRVKVLPYSTFRLNLSVTTPYNADFDGDEMNMHVPQTPEGRAEIAEIMMVPRQIVSPQKNSPVMGIVQDTLLGSLRFTQRDTFVSKDVMMNCLMWIDDWNGRLPMPAILKPEPMWTGKQLFSLILPKVNVKKDSKSHRSGKYGEKGPGPEGQWIDGPPHGAITLFDTKIVISKGELLTGIVDKPSLGVGTAGSLIHVIWLEYGPEAAKMFMSQIQRLVNYWLLQHAFTVGLGDCIATESLIDANNALIEKAKVDATRLIHKARRTPGSRDAEGKANRLEVLPGLSYIATFESEVRTLFVSPITLIDILFP
jgi:DNA-directed RNA polymerase II subunit RPB1